MGKISIIEHLMGPTLDRWTADYQSSKYLINKSKEVRYL